MDSGAVTILFKGEQTSKECRSSACELGLRGDDGSVATYGKRYGFKFTDVCIYIRLSSEM